MSLIIQEVEIDLSDAMGKEYKVSSATEGYFKEMDVVPADFSPSWEAEEMEKNKVTVPENDKIIIKTIMGYGTYFVQYK